MSLSSAEGFGAGALAAGLASFLPVFLTGAGDSLAARPTNVAPHALQRIFLPSTSLEALSCLSHSGQVTVMELAITLVVGFDGRRTGYRFRISGRPRRGH